jgi:hypothetical protein
MIPEDGSGTAVTLIIKLLLRGPLQLLPEVVEAYAFEVITFVTSQRNEGDPSGLVRVVPRATR